MSLVAVVPVTNMAAANAAIFAANAEWGPSNFSIPAFSNGNPTHGCLHTWGPAALETAIKALAGVTFEQSAGDPATRLRALLATAGAQWGADAPALPSVGLTVAGRHYLDNSRLWLSLVAFDRTVWSGPPEGLAASIIRRIRRPGEVLPWRQPIDQFDAYWTKNAFTGQPDRVTHNGRLWRSIVADVPNVWPPGTAGIWADEGPAP